MAQNPVFNEKTLRKLTDEGVLDEAKTMTINGSINKAGILLVLMTLTSAYSSSIADSEFGLALMVGSVFVNLVLAFVLIFNRQLAPTLAPVYALVEGLSIGAVSAWANRSYPGIVSNAMILTFSCLALMIGLYHYQIVRVTERFRSVLLAATLAITFTYLINLGLMFFGLSIPMIHSSGPYGIAFSVVVVAVAAFNLLLDFDTIERAAAQRAPKYMEWYAGFAVLVTLVWLYLEILRLLGKMSKK